MMLKTRSIQDTLLKGNHQCEIILTGMMTNLLVISTFNRILRHSRLLESTSLPLMEKIQETGTVNVTNIFSLLNWTNTKKSLLLLYTLRDARLLVSILPNW